jgi:hypothetical protein
MKSVFFLLSIVLLFSCNIGETVEGNANIKKEIRDVNDFTGISVSGPFIVTVQQGNTFSVSVEADENLMQYIEVKKNGSTLQIAEMDGYNLRGTKGLRVTVQLPEVGELSIAGSGTINTQSAIKNTGTIKFSIAGSGKIDAGVDAPEVDVDIAGSGTANLNGQTRKMSVSISGSGDCLAENLKSENCSIDIAGSGLAKVFSSTNLDVSIGGSGDVYYSGKPQNVNKSIAGSGKVKEL